MKKRIALVALSAVLVFSLTIGGTLMLFTAQSEKATNVVTVGNIKVALLEAGENTGYKTVGENGFTGLSFPSTMPGDTLIKQPRVKNTGDNDLYAAVYGKVSFSKEGTTLGWDEVTDLINETLEKAEVETYGLTQAEKNYAFLNHLILKDGIDKNWVGAPVDTDEGEFFGTWFYVNDNNGLAPLAPGAETTDIFNKVTIPEDLSDLAQGVKIELTMFAYAVQSDNVNPGNSVAEWEEFFGNAGK
jgi:predicted ribosomally synthesized peptide with SipW-like signal peptide